MYSTEVPGKGVLLLRTVLHVFVLTPTCIRPGVAKVRVPPALVRVSPSRKQGGRRYGGKERCGVWIYFALSYFPESE